jgi:hypothetical protein
VQRWRVWLVQAGRITVYVGVYVRVPKTWESAEIGSQALGKSVVFAGFLRKVGISGGLVSRDANEPKKAEAISERYNSLGHKVLGIRPWRR